MKDEIQYILSRTSQVSTTNLSKQPAVTLKEAKAQAQWLKTNSTTKKKQRN